MFNNTQDADRNDESPLLSFYDENQQRERAQWQAELAAVEQALEQPSAERLAAQQRWEQNFPLELAWQTLVPAVVTSQAGAAAAATADGVVNVAAGAKNDTYTLELTPPAQAIGALRLEALTDDALPGKGPGHAGGNFVVTKIAAVVAPPQGQSPSGRFVRIELPGKGRMLSLAEVQVLRGSENLARSGTASQSSTDYAGPAELAIDGNTNGDYTAAHSTTHTAASDNPWWEVDLKSQQPLDRIVVWNRTDGGVGERLAGFHLIVLNDARQPVWEQTVPTAPKPSAELSPNGQRGIELITAVADYAQSGFEAENVIANKDPNQKGWAIGGQVGQPHSLWLIARAPVEVAAGSKLIVTIEQGSQHAEHTLGRFRLSASD